MTNPTPSDLKRFQRDPAAFRARLLIPISGGPKPLGEVAADFQRRDFAALDPAFIALARGKKPEPYSRFFITRTKGASKGSDVTSMLLWLVAFAPRSLMIRIGAAKQDQADETRKIALDYVRLNGWLGSLIEIRADSILNPKTGTRADILTTDGVGTHGGRPSLTIIDELTHLSDREFAETLADDASKVPHGVLLIATNAGHANSWQAEWRQAAIDSPRWYHSEHCQPAPWLDPAELAEAKRRNSPGRYARLWEGVWGSPESSAIRPDDLAAAITLPGPISEPEQGWTYVAGLDLGLTRDASALCVLGIHTGYTEREKIEDQPEYANTAMRAMADLGFIKPRSNVGRLNTTRVKEHVPGTGRIRLSRLKAWRPTGGSQVSIEAIEQEVLRLHERFRFTLAFDPWNAALLNQRLRRAGVRTAPFDFSPSNLKEMATVVLEAFAENEIELYDDADLTASLRKLIAVEKSYGMRLDAKRDKGGGHADEAFAFAIAAVQARRTARNSQTTRINRPLMMGVYP